MVQLPGVRDLTRAKALIGETARLEFKHRILSLEREIGGVTSEDIVSVNVALMPGVEPLPPGQPSQLPFTTSTLIEATTTEASAAQDVETTGTPPSEDTSTEAALQKLLQQALTSTAPGASTAPESPNLVPALVLEFTEDAAEEFAGVVDRLRESLEPLQGTEVGYPNLLRIFEAGGTSTPIQIPYSPIALLPGGQIVLFGEEPYIQRFGTSTLFTISLESARLEFEEAQARFDGNSEIRLVEVLGKVDEDVGLTGEDLARAYPGQRFGSGLPIVNIEFNNEGTRKFGMLTSQIAGTPDLLAIVLDDAELIAPTVSQPILGGAAIIEGRGFTFERVRDISLLLESGRLPIPIELIKEESVDAILGADSLAKSVVAGLVGLGLVLLFMVLYYRAPGVVAAGALIIYAAMLLAIFKITPVTLRLAGISAAILSIGMAVDANILIFERMKEELRAGRTLLSAINIGFNRAWPAIRDSNVSTLITCGILFWFADTLGAPIVLSFAVTLSIGVAVSLFSAITISRTFLRLLATTALSRHLGLFVPGGQSDLPRQQPGAADMRS